MVESMTDNKNRAVADIRHIFNKCGGNLGENGCVSYMFDKKGLIEVNKSDVKEDTLMETALEAGAEDIREEDTTFEVITEPQALEAVKEALDAATIKYNTAEVTMIPQTTLNLSGKEAEQMFRLMEMLEDCEDVQKLHTNAEIPDELMR